MTFTKRIFSALTVGVIFAALCIVPALTQSITTIPSGTGGGGGSGTPGGATTQLQYNNAGAFAGIAGLTWDGTTLTAGAIPINLGAANPLTIPPFTNLAVGASTLTYAATTDIDFLGDGFRTETLTGNVTFTTSNRAAGRSVTVRIIGDGTARTLTFPAWKFIGGAAPTSLAINETAVLAITALGTADTDVIASYSTATGLGLTLAAGKSLTVNNTLTLAGTDATTMTFPATSATLARTDAANTFTGTQTMGAAVVTTLNGHTFTSGSSTFTGTAGQTYTFPTTTATLARTDAANTFTGTQTFAGLISAAAGTASLAPINIPAGTVKTTPAAGDEEFDGAQFYRTIDTTSSRGGVPVEQYFHLTADAGAPITSIANFFGSTSNPSIVSGGYYIIDAYMFFVTTGTGTVVFTFTNSAAPTSQNILWEESPIAGMVAPPGTATLLVGQVINDATAAKAITTGSLTAGSHYVHVRFWIKNSTGTSFKIQVNNGTATNVTPKIGSWWHCRRMAPGNVGAFVN